MDVLLLPGDGIGPEIARVTRRALECLDRTLSLDLHIDQDHVGFSALEKYGATITDALVARVRTAELVILGPVATAAYPPPAQGGLNPSAVLRKNLDLYANIRPARAYRGVPAATPAMDLVVVRENTEGFYADRTMFAGSGEMMPSEDLALALRKVTRQGSYRVAAVAARLAAARRGRLTIVHKANVLKLSDGLFLSAAREAARIRDGLEVDDVHVDAAASLLVRSPERFDVIVTTNMFGDILSNQAAELAGGLGLAGALNVGDHQAIAQATHGSAPDIAGQDRANPVSLLLSTAMLLEWRSQVSARADLHMAASRLRAAITTLLAQPHSRTGDLGGTLGTTEFGDQLCSELEKSN